eukprot:Colp12_sorted_trinity150504_noHs@9428
MAAQGRVIVGGGTGFIGRALCKKLKSKGLEVIVISRTPGEGKLTWDELESKGLPECLAALNLAGEPLVGSVSGIFWNESFKNKVRSSRIDTTRKLAAAIKKAAKPPKVFINISGVAGYPSSETNVYDETYEVKPFDFLSQLVVDWEKAAELPKDLPVRRVTVREGVVLGRDGGMIQQQWLPMIAGLAPPIGPGNQWLPWIHISDLVRLFEYAIENEHVSGVLNGVAPLCASNREVTVSFAEAMGPLPGKVVPWLPHVPAFALKLALGTDRALMLTEGPKVDPRRVLQLGFKYDFPDIKSAMHDIVNNSH